MSKKKEKTPSEPFLRSNTADTICPVCGDAVILRSEYKNTYSHKKDLKTLKSHAEKWRNLDISENDTI